MITVVVKDVMFPKLTLAKGRSEVKIPLGTDRMKMETLLRFASEVEAEAGEIQYTLRGKFRLSEGKWRIEMYSGSTNGAGHSTEKHFKTFSEK